MVQNAQLLQPADQLRQQDNQKHQQMAETSGQQASVPAPISNSKDFPVKPKSPPNENNQLQMEIDTHQTRPLTASQQSTRLEQAPQNHRPKHCTTHSKQFRHDSYVRPSTINNYITTNTSLAANNQNNQMLQNNNQQQQQSDQSQVVISADYLAQLIKDNKQLSVFPAVFLHIQRLLDEEICRVRQSLFQLSDVVQMQGPLILPEPEGEIVELQEKVYVPVESHPEYNFVGRILGPRGMTAKQLEQETGCRIKIRGKGSMRDKKKEDLYCGKANWEHLSDELHVLITVEDTPNRAQLKIRRSLEEVKRLLIPIIDGEDELKKRQLIELAIINGTYRNGLGAANLQQSNMQQHQHQNQNTYLHNQHAVHQHVIAHQQHHQQHLPASFLSINGSSVISSGVPSTGSNTPNSVHSSQQMSHQINIGQDIVSHHHHQHQQHHHQHHHQTHMHGHHVHRHHQDQIHHAQLPPPSSQHVHQAQLNQSQAATLAAVVQASQQHMTNSEHVHHHIHSHHQNTHPHQSTQLGHLGAPSTGSHNQPAAAAVAAAAALMAVQQQQQQHLTAGHQDPQGAATAIASNALLYAQQQYHEFQYAALAVQQHQHHPQHTGSSNEYYHIQNLANNNNNHSGAIMSSSNAPPEMVAHYGKLPLHDGSLADQSCHLDPSQRNSINNKKNIVESTSKSQLVESQAEPDKQSNDNKQDREAVSMDESPLGTETRTTTDNLDASKTNLSSTGSNSRQQQAASLPATG